MIRICLCKCILRAPHPRKEKGSCNMFSMRRLTCFGGLKFSASRLYLQYILYILISSLDIIYTYIYPKRSPTRRPALGPHGPPPSSGWLKQILFLAVKRASILSGPKENWERRAQKDWMSSMVGTFDVI